MTGAGVLQIVIFYGLILVCVKPLGSFMARLFEGAADTPASGAAMAGNAHVQGGRR